MSEDKDKAAEILYEALHLSAGLDHATSVRLITALEVLIEIKILDHMSKFARFVEKRAQTK